MTLILPNNNLIIEDIALIVPNNMQKISLIVPNNRRYP